MNRISSIHFILRSEYGRRYESTVPPVLISDRKGRDAIMKENAVTKWCAGFHLQYYHDSFDGGVSMVIFFVVNKIIFRRGRRRRESSYDD